MIFYSEKEITIRTMTEKDIQVIVKEEIAQGWELSSPKKYLKRLNDMAEKKSIALVAEYGGNVAGYINVYFLENIPEIVDFGVLRKYQRRGIGTKLMDVAEDIALKKADSVFLFVGLHSGYGSAQRMYIKRGYVPDGKGVYYGNEPCVPYESYVNDDNLLLKLSMTKNRFQKIKDRSLER